MNHQRKDCMGEAADALTQMPILTTGWELCKYFCFTQKLLFFDSQRDKVPNKKEPAIPIPCISPTLSLLGEQGS